MLTHAGSRTRHMPRWFLYSGGMGLAIAIILADLLSHDLMAHDLGSTALLKLLWPASAINGAGGTSVVAQLLDGLLMYGGQFLLYGCLGLLIASLAGRVGSRIGEQDVALGRAVSRNCGQRTSQAATHGVETTAGDQA